MNNIITVLKGIALIVAAINGNNAFTKSVAAIVIDNKIEKSRRNDIATKNLINAILN